MWGEEKVMSNAVDALIHLSISFNSPALKGWPTGDDVEERQINIHANENTQGPHHWPENKGGEHS